MSTSHAARWLRELAKEALAASRLEAIDLPAAKEPLAFRFEGIDEPLRFERRGEAFAASIVLDDDYNAAANELQTQLGRPEHAGPDPHGVRWASYRSAQSYGVVLLVERDDAAVLHLEPFARAKPFTGIEPDVASWFAARSSTTSRPAAEARAARDAQRALRKATKRPGSGNRLTNIRVRELATWFGELGGAALDRATVERFATAHDLVIDDDHPFAGRTYLIPSLSTRLHIDAAFSYVMAILAESEGESGAEDALRAVAHERRHAGLRTDMVAALGKPVAEGTYTSISTERWAVWRRTEAVIALVTGMDPRGDSGHATALRLVVWPAGRDLPAFDKGVSDWINAQVARPKKS